MASGNKNAGQEIGKSTRFTRENAAEMARRANEARRKKTSLREIANLAMYGHPPLPDEQLKPIADFFGIKPAHVSFAHLAMYKQVSEMAKGDLAALNAVAAYAGEDPKSQPTEQADELLQQAREILGGVSSVIK